MAYDEITENSALRAGEGSIEKGDRSNGTYLEAYVVCCDCNLPYKNRDRGWRQAVAEALAADRLDVLRSLCDEDLDTDEIVGEWNDWKAAEPRGLISEGSRETGSPPGRTQRFFLTTTKRR